LYSPLFGGWGGLWDPWAVRDEGLKDVASCRGSKRGRKLPRRFTGARGERTNPGTNYQLLQHRRRKGLKENNMKYVRKRDKAIASPKFYRERSESFIKEYWLMKRKLVLDSLVFY